MFRGTQSTQKLLKHSIEIRRNSLRKRQQGTFRIKKLVPKYYIIFRWSKKLTTIFYRTEVWSFSALSLTHLLTDAFKTCWCDSGWEGCQLLSDIITTMVNPWVRCAYGNFKSINDAGAHIFSSNETKKKKKTWAKEHLNDGNLKVYNWLTKKRSDWPGLELGVLVWQTQS